METFSRSIPSADMRRAMGRNLIHICLAAAAMVVLYLPVREYILNRRVTADLNELKNFLGEFELVDPKRVYFRALEVNEHLQYAWRIYLPENTNIARRLDVSKAGSYGSESIISSRGQPARQFVLHMQVEIRPEEIQMSISDDLGGGTTMLSLKGHPHQDEFQKLLDPKLALVKQFAKGVTVEVEIDQVVALLSLGTESSKALAEPIDPLVSASISPAAMYIMTREEMQAMSPEERRKLRGGDRFKDKTRASETVTP